MIVLLILLSLLLSTATALVPPSSTTNLSIFALNANGLVQPVKVKHVNDAIKARLPHVFVIGETKTNSKLSDNLPYDSYDIYEEPGQPANGNHTFNWGVVVGIHKNLQVVQRMIIDNASLKGRAIVINIMLPTYDGHCFPHRIISVYAPWNPGLTDLTTRFWPEIENICTSTQSSWSLVGDLNATITPLERATGTDGRAAFSTYLHNSSGIDLWSLDDNRSRRNDWTSRGHSNGGGNIIDHIVSSDFGFVDGKISAADKRSDWIPYTDHRPITASIILSHPRGAPSAATARNFDASIRCEGRHPRIRFPSKSDKHKYQAYQDAVDAKVQGKSIQSKPIQTDDEFLSLYSELTEIINSTAADVFGKAKPYTKKATPITNSKIQEVIRDVHAIGGAIRYEQSACLVPTSPQGLRMHAKALTTTLSQIPHLEVMSVLKTERRALHKSLFAEKAKEILLRATRKDKARISAALRNGSTKRMVCSNNFIPLPLAVNDLDDPTVTHCTPEKVKNTTREYFKRLYDHSRVPDLPKPWLKTSSVTEVRQRVNQDPFNWPRPCSIENFRALLRRGNNRPSPGPDQWEKWAVKALSDDALTLVLDLHNYTVERSRFPGPLTDMWLTTFHKKGLRTNLQNWRGLLISNFLANSPMAWLNHSLLTYSAEKRILPDTQVATQPGVQTCDLISFLAGVKCWAHRNDTTVYALKCDQMKGFDYLSPDGFYDAVRSYGLPEAIINLDKAAQTNTKCFVQTAYGITDPIVVSGVNKQGGPASPLKSTFTTSLGHYYLNDLLAKDKDALVISSTCLQKHDPHTPNATETLLVSMVEATDDSYIFSRSLSSLRVNALTMERFQYAYEWLTQWAKSRAYILSPHPDTDIPDKLIFQSVSTEPGIDLLTVTEHEVSLTVDELDFLRTKVNDPKSHYTELQAFIQSFKLPTVIGRLPITLIRKIIAQNIISRCRALLYLQPILPKDADALDKLIISRVHDILGFPFTPNTSIATLPIAMHGLSFPSVQRINTSIAVDGIARDLNHHIAAYRTMANITLSDWTCQKNNCLCPLSDLGYNRNKTINPKAIPSAWITSQQVMRNLSISLIKTDQSYITNSQVSLSHIINILKILYPDQTKNINRTTLRPLRLKGFRTLANLGEWCIHPSRRIYFHTDHPPDNVALTIAGRHNWTLIAGIFRDLTSLSNHIQGPTELSITPTTRERNAETLINALADISLTKPSSFSNGSDWASDGSMIPPSAGIHDDKSVVGALVGPVSLALRIPGRNVCVLQGEQAGLIIGLVVSSPKTNANPSRLLTDHLNSVRLISDSKTQVSQIPRLRYMNGRSYYRWILSLCERNNISIQYTRGHTAEDTTESNLNNEADKLATSSQHHIHDIPTLPTPTFHMNPYTFYHKSDGWIESNVGSYVDSSLARLTATNLSIGHKNRMATWLYNPESPPEHPYLTTLSAYSATVQLYARSGQLPTADILYRCGKAQSDSCRIGCDEIETPHHLFVHCKPYEEWRKTAAKELLSRTTLKLSSFGVNNTESKNLILRAAECLFLDEPSIWPLKISQYFIGQIPNINPIIDTISEISIIERKRLKIHLAADWHLASIRLAGRIFGDVQKRMASRYCPQNPLRTPQSPN